MLKLFRNLFSNLSPKHPGPTSTHNLYSANPHPQSEAERKFRAEAKDADLILIHFMPGTRMHCLGLDGGAVMLIDPTPERLYNLVKLARKHAKSTDNGEHKAILGLSVYENEVKRFNDDRAPAYALHWSKRSHQPDRDDLITAEKYLTDNGFDLSDAALVK